MPKALAATGAAAEAHAKRNITDNGSVDTGRLRNSITYAVSVYTGIGTYHDNKGNSV